MSDDGRYGLTIIAFIGSVFSPYYVQSGKVRPQDHVALNVALYGRGARRWTMTERGEPDLHRDRQTLSIGPSAMEWDGNRLTIRIDEVSAVFGQRVRGTVVLYPEALVGAEFALDSDGLHRWQPVATRARLEATFDQPGLSWKGDAYLDSNFGAEPMEARFARWQWSRAHVRDGTAVFYEGTRLDGGQFALSLRIDRQGMVHHRELPPLKHLRPSNWLMPRSTRSDGRARVLKTWEDTPFYSRSALVTDLDGERALAVHESLSLTRFISPAMQWMLPYRMPRKTA